VFVYVVTPHGGTEDELRRTAASVEAVATAQARADVHFVHLVVLNNGSGAAGVAAVDQVRLERRILDINPVASRAAARNHALDQIDTPGFMLLLDAGDELLTGVLDCCRLAAEVGPSGLVVRGRSLVRSGDMLVERGNRPPWLARYVNPFLLSSVLVSTDLVASVRFEEGRKEDWKFWLAVLARRPQRIDSPALVYVYVVKSGADHFRRKLRLVTDQVQFFRDHLGMSWPEVLLACTAYFLVSGWFWLSVEVRGRLRRALAGRDRS
jgi:hypothetical protein